MALTVQRRTRLLAALALFALLTTTVVLQPAARAQTPSAHEVNDALGMGINLGNALEAPREGDWGLVLQPEYFALIADAGFRHVRVPIRFSAYADQNAPYTITDGVDPTVTGADNLWDRIDWVIAQAEANGLYAIIDLHLYEELHDNVAGHRDRFLSIWRQISERYADASSLVLFELLNEPRGQFNDDPSLLNALLADALAIVRATNPDRIVLVGPAAWNRISWLGALQLPNDPNLIVSVHFYEPFEFTHQGATWVDPIPPAPAVWNRNETVYGFGWRDWSWDTDVTFGSASLTATYRRRWAGLQFGLTAPFDPVSVRVTIDGAATLDIECGRDGGPGLVQDTIETVRGGSAFDIDLTGCPSDTNRVAFKVTSASFDTLTYRNMTICDGARCRRPFETEAESIDSAIAEAAAWGAANNRPIHVGEFGAYSAEGLADLGERAEWTQVVATAIKTHGASASYWEFGSGFGAYDRNARAWIQPLLNALAPTSGEPLCMGLPITINMSTNGGNGVGTAGDDVILGTAGADVIDGLAGNDVICSLGGNDQVTGGEGDDRIDGGSGDDRLLGAQGHDTIDGGPDDDVIHGNRGNDSLTGNQGDDRIFGYAGNDTIDGGSGDDRLHGNFGDDVIDAGTGDDRAFGYGDDDTIDMGPGNDLAGGNRGDDRIEGGDGDDTLYGSDGNDVVSGGAGNDNVQGNSLDDIVNGGDGNDTLDGGINTDTCHGGNGTDIATRCETTLAIP